MQKQSIDGQLLLRTVAHALRHDPLKYGMELDPAGWTDLDELVVALRFDRYDWALLESRDLELAITDSGSARFEMCNDRIRAVYGHSIQLTSIGTPETPPAVLWHGLPLEVLATVMREGLRPIRRRFVHLTTNPEYARQVARSKGTEALLLVCANQAQDAGAHFFRANHHVWLADQIAPAFLAHQDSAPSSAEANVSSLLRRDTHTRSSVLIDVAHELGEL